MEGWLEQADLKDTWIEVIDQQGTRLGWIERSRIGMLGLQTQLIETPKRYLTDSYVRYHAQLAYERGLLSRGQDLNDVQIALLGGQIIKQNERDEKLRIRKFEEDMLINNGELFKAYQEKKERQAETDAATLGVEERVPASIEEFLATLAAFSEDEPAGSGKKQEGADGWLHSILSDEDLSEMED
jgi:hypothetical protein